MLLFLSILFLVLSGVLGWTVFGAASPRVGLGVHVAFLLSVACFLWTLIRALSRRASQEVGRWEDDEEDDPPSPPPSAVARPAHARAEKRASSGEGQHHERKHASRRDESQSEHHVGRPPGFTSA